MSGRLTDQKNDKLFNSMFLTFLHFLDSNVPDNKCHKQKWCMLFFTCIKLVHSVQQVSPPSPQKQWHVCWCVHMLSFDSNGEDCHVLIFQTIKLGQI